MSQIRFLKNQSRFLWNAMYPNGVLKFKSKGTDIPSFLAPKNHNLRPHCRKFGTDERSERRRERENVPFSYFRLPPSIHASIEKSTSVRRITGGGGIERGRWKGRERGGGTRGESDIAESEMWTGSVVGRVLAWLREAEWQMEAARVWEREKEGRGQVGSKIGALNRPVPYTCAHLRIRVYNCPALKTSVNMFCNMSPQKQLIFEIVSMARV